VATVPEIISAMREAAPAGQQNLDHAALGELRSLTQALIAAAPYAEEECGRFLRLRDRGIAVPEAKLDAWLGGATVLVTGGTGCIGSALMAQVAGRCPRRLVSVSRGLASGWPRLSTAEYAQADIRDRCRLAAVFDEVRPDVVFHLAAQRDPGLAEHQVHRTVTTNVLGTSHVISAAEEFGVERVVFASTGKALRPYSREVYTASKRAAEWLMSSAAARGKASYSAARFTHVVDNSIIYARLLDWCQGGVIRLHAADIMFYAQSARESAQLLLLAGLGAGGAGGRAAGGRGKRLWVQAITDLGWPVGLLDLALGVLTRADSETPIYFSGYDPGYESMPFPGLAAPGPAAGVRDHAAGRGARGARRAVVVAARRHAESGAARGADPCGRAHRAVRGRAEHRVPADPRGRVPARGSYLSKPGPSCPRSAPVAPSRGRVTPVRQ
jgi:FlaA1/EpsC-like NDP-sugar epimerase